MAKTGLKARIVAQNCKTLQRQLASSAASIVDNVGRRRIIYEIYPVSYHLVRFRGILGASDRSMVRILARSNIHVNTHGKPIRA